MGHLLVFWEEFLVKKFMLQVYNGCNSLQPFTTGYYGLLKVSTFTTGYHRLLHVTIDHELKYGSSTPFQLDLQNILYIFKITIQF